MDVRHEGAGEVVGGIVDEQHSRVIWLRTNGHANGSCGPTPPASNDTRVLFVNNAPDDLTRPLTPDIHTNYLKYRPKRGRIA